MYHCERASVASYHLHDTVTRLYEVLRHFFLVPTMRRIRCLCFPCLLGRVPYRVDREYSEFDFIRLREFNMAASRAKITPSVTKCRACVGNAVKLSFDFDSEILNARYYLIGYVEAFVRTETHESIFLYV